MSKSPRYMLTVQQEVAMAELEAQQDIDELNAFYAWELDEYNPSDPYWEDDDPVMPLGGVYDPSLYDLYDYGEFTD